MSHFVFELPIVEYFTISGIDDEHLEEYIYSKVRVLKDEQGEYYLSSLTLSVPLKAVRVDTQIHQVSRDTAESVQFQSISSLNSNEIAFLVNNLFSIINKMICDTTKIICGERIGPDFLLEKIIE
ncbi:hypothetical protein [Lactococcus garvieae]|nr:hypothetical protein [Lactococcus garvieae]UYT12312.1 hypothetical protein OF800_10060 [Lactococcus garvieae]